MKRYFIKLVLGHLVQSGVIECETFAAAYERASTAATQTALGFQREEPARIVEIREKA